ncbi:MAG: hypothetical protein ACLR1T_08480 [Evtepia gabavorous]
MLPSGTDGTSPTRWRTPTSFWSWWPRALASRFCWTLRLSTARM